jgi:trehalose-phosphatase
LNGSGSTLLAFDFDGTLAPICDDPADVRLGRAATALLAEASGMERTVVAIVSGRDVDDLAARTGVHGAYLVGSHGLEIRAPGNVAIRDAPPLSSRPPADLVAAIEAASLRLEWKKHAVALHWRGVLSGEVEPLAGRFREWGEGEGLDLIDGRQVLEARMHGGGKEGALRWLAGATAAGRVVYAGDDLTDFGALRFASERGRGLFLASDERTPPPGVTVVQTFRELLRLVRAELA